MLDEHVKPVNLLITKPDGFLAHPDNMSNRWRKIVEKYKLPKITFHDLHHTQFQEM